DSETLAPATALRAEQLSFTVKGTTTLQPVGLAVRPGELVAIAGGSGAGKTTLLELLAGIRRPSPGPVTGGGDGPAGHHLAGSGRPGCVPQDAIIHAALPLRRTLVHAARLRIERHAGVDPEQVVDEVLDRMGLTERAAVRVSSLSGGQRKRAS